MYFFNAITKKLDLYSGKKPKFNSIEYINPYWEDIRISAEQTRVNPATVKPDYEPFLTDLRALSFSLITQASGLVNSHQKNSFDEIDGSGIDSLSTMLLCSLSRIGGDADDTFTGEARFLEFDFHYQINSPGSTAEYTK